VATLEAGSSLGLLRGLQTFTQLVYTLPGKGSERFIQNTSLIIEDKPAFHFRGYLLDTSRNFYPIEDIKRTLNAMSWAKLNVFNWHITDSQSWPLEVPKFPELQAKGAYSADQTYSIKDVKDIIDYGAALGITVMLEIDTPGHTASIAESHPSYVACFESSPWGSSANEPPAGQLRFPDPKVDTFINEVMSSVLHEVEGLGSYWSTGGDELNVPCYTNDAATNATLKKQGLTLEQSLTKFVLGTHDTVKHYKKTPAVWEEMALSHEVGPFLDKDTLVLTWLSAQDSAAVAEMGLKVVHSSYQYFYLDCGGGAWLGNDIDGLSWCDPFKSWQLAYSFDPYANITKANQKNIFGGQALLWSEQADPSNLDPITWPRAAAIGEIFWTGEKGAFGKRDVTEALPRLHDWRYRAVARGVRAIALQPEWCAVRPYVCDADA